MQVHLLFCPTTAPSKRCPASSFFYFFQSVLAALFPLIPVHATGLDPPELATIRSGVRLRWQVPRQPHSSVPSMIFEAERRSVVDASAGPDFYDGQQRIYRGKMTYFEDHSEELKPFTR